MHNSNITFIVDKLINGGGERLLNELLKVLNNSDISHQIIFFGRLSNLEEDTLNAFQKITKVIVIDKNEGLHKLSSQLLKSINANTIIHSFSISTNLHAKLLKPIHRAPLICHHHGNAEHLPRLPVYINRWSFFLSNCNISVSYGCESSNFRSLPLLFPHKFRVMYNGLEIPEITQPRHINKITSTLHLVFVGRLVESKNISELLETLQELNKQLHKPPYLSVVGDGALRPNLENEIYKKGLTNQIRFYGNLDNSQTLKVISTSDLMIFPSMAEGLGIVLIEASALSIPSIAFNVSGVNEVIVHGSTGLLVDPRKGAKGLAVAISSLDNDTIKKMSQQARSRYQKTFSFAKLESDYVSIINALS